MLFSAAEEMLSVLFSWICLIDGCLLYLGLELLPASIRQETGICGPIISLSRSWRRQTHLYFHTHLLHDRRSVQSNNSIWLLQMATVFHASALATAVARGIVFSGCLSIPFLWMHYLRSPWREFLIIWQKHPLGLKDELNSQNMCFWS